MDMGLTAYQPVSVVVGMKTHPRRSSMKPAEQQQNIRPVPPSACVDSWWRTHSATMALLKHTCAQMEEAEQLIAKQEARIRQLENLADTDCLTGLLNRRGFERLY